MEGPSRQALVDAHAALDGLERDAGGNAAAALAEVSDQMFAVSTLLGREIGLRRALADSGVPAAARTGLLDRLVGNQLGGPTLDLLHTLVSARWSRAYDLLAAVEELGAQALLAVAQTDGVLDDVEDDLFRFGRVVDDQPKLALAMSDPSLPPENKHGLIDALLDGKVRDATLLLVNRAVQDPLRRPVEKTLADLGRLAAERRQRLVAVVTVASRLDEEQAERLRAAVSRVFGRDVQLQVDVDPAVLGGVVVRVGDEVLDSSVLRRLADARRQLLR